MLQCGIVAVLQVVCFICLKLLEGDLGILMDVVFDLVGPHGEAAVRLPLW